MKWLSGFLTCLTVTSLGLYFFFEQSGAFQVLPERVAERPSIPDHLKRFFAPSTYASNTNVPAVRPSEMGPSRAQHSGISPPLSHPKGFAAPPRVREKQAKLDEQQRLVEQPVRVVRLNEAGSANAWGSHSLTISTVGARVALTRDIQKELKRVGCRVGRIDGDWGDNTQSAMRHFINNINATLPIGDPDVVLLSMLRNHQGGKCGAVTAVAGHAVRRKRRFEHRASNVGVSARQTAQVAAVTQSSRVHISQNWRAILKRSPRTVKAVSSVRSLAQSNPPGKSNAPNTSTDVTQRYLETPNVVLVRRPRLIRNGQMALGGLRVSRPKIAAHLQETTVMPVRLRPDNPSQLTRQSVTAPIRRWAPVAPDRTAVAPIERAPSSAARRASNKRQDIRRRQWRRYRRHRQASWKQRALKGED